jgi:hypothetical protein
MSTITRHFASSLLHYTLRPIGRAPTLLIADIVISLSQPPAVATRIPLEQRLLNDTYAEHNSYKRCVNSVEMFPMRLFQTGQ